MVRPNGKPQVPVLNEQWAAFIQSGVSVIVASRDSRNLPILARGAGCRVSPGRKKITVFLSNSQAEALINSVRSTAAIGAVFTQPSTHTSLQLKGTDAMPGRLKATDIDLVKRWVEAFVADTVVLGYSEELMRAIVWCDAADLMSLSFTPTSAFLQTPGPRAGEPLRY